MDENTIKAAVLTRIRQQARRRPLPVVASEFSLAGTGIRADLVILGADFAGIEIKGSGDTLKRLPSQLEGYARYCDRTLLVVASKHLRGLRDINLHGAQVWRYDVLCDWQLEREGVERKTSGHWLLQLLTAEEEKRAARALSNLADEPSLDLDMKRRGEFERAFKRRYQATSDAFWQTVSGRPIKAADIALLSRFYTSRRAATVAAAESEGQWARWTERMNAAVLGDQPPQSSSVSNIAPGSSKNVCL